MASKRTQEQSCALMSQLGDSGRLALDPIDLGRAAMLADKYPAAKTYFSRALKIWKRLDDPWGIALTWTAWGEAAIERDPDLARQFLEGALELYPRVGAAGVRHWLCWYWEN